MFSYGSMTQFDSHYKNEKDKEKLAFRKSSRIDTDLDSVSLLVVDFKFVKLKYEKENPAEEEDEMDGDEEDDAAPVPRA